MLRQRWLAGLTLVLLAPLLFGSADDAGCGGTVKTAEQLCTSTGGTWGNYPYWPAECGDDPATAHGPAAGGEPVCACPAQKPNWTDGKGCRKCDIGHCKGYPTQCESISSFSCYQQKGCYSSGETCSGFAQLCDWIESQVGCWMQQGCFWMP